MFFYVNCLIELILNNVLHLVFERKLQKSLVHEHCHIPNFNQYKYQQYLGLFLYNSSQWINCISSWAFVGHLPECQGLEFLDIDLSELLDGWEDPNYLRPGLHMSVQITRCLSSESNLLDLATIGCDSRPPSSVKRNLFSLGWKFDSITSTTGRRFKRGWKREFPTDTSQWSTSSVPLED